MTRDIPTQTGTMTRDTPAPKTQKSLATPRNDVARLHNGGDGGVWFHDIVPVCLTSSFRFLSHDIVPWVCHDIVPAVSRVIVPV